MSVAHVLSHAVGRNGQENIPQHPFIVKICYKDNTFMLKSIQINKKNTTFATKYRT